jgi:putative exosortase-associated protein (TIGR04073 family)
MRRSAYIFGLGLLLCAFSSSASEDVCRGVGVSSEVPAHGEIVGAQAGRKFFRGLLNVLTGSGEIPRQMIRAGRRGDCAALDIPTGFCSGIFMCVVRTTYGAVEMASFPMPLDGTYDSLLKPDYVWGPAGGETKEAEAGNGETR